jgi:hypothetical protein
MSTTVYSSWSDALVRGPSTASIEAPHKVGEVVHATVLVGSPMNAFDLSCSSGSDRRRKELQANAHRMNEENNQIMDKPPRPCVIISTEQVTRNRWNYELCLLASFGNKPYSELTGDTKRLALPVYQGLDQPSDCERETRIPAFVFQPLLKPRPSSYLIGYPIVRSGSCIQSVAGEAEHAMAREEVRRLKTHCDRIKQQKREVLSK